MDSPLFFIILFCHLSFLILAFGAVMVTDHFGLRWMRDKVPFGRLIRTAEVTERLVWVGWAGMVLSGIGLATIKGFIDNLTWIKIFFVGVAGANGVLLYALLRRMQRYEKTDTVPTALMFRLGVSLVLSQIAWWGAFLIGFLHRHVQSRIEWPPLPWLWMLLFLAGFAGVWAMGEWWLSRRPSRVQVEAPEEVEQPSRPTEPVIDPLDKI